MMLGDPRGAHVILGAAPETDTYGGTGPDVYVGVEVHVAGFSASIGSIVERQDWREFLEGLSRLEETRRGEAVLRSADERDLRLRIFARGLAGHVAIEGELSRHDVPEHPAFQFAGIELEPTGLLALLRELRESALAV